MGTRNERSRPGAAEKGHDNHVCTLYRARDVFAFHKLFKFPRRMWIVYGKYVRRRTGANTILLYASKIGRTIRANTGFLNFRHFLFFHTEKINRRSTTNLVRFAWLPFTITKVKWTEPSGCLASCFPFYRQIVTKNFQTFHCERWNIINNFSLRAVDPNFRNFSI